MASHVLNQGQPKASTFYVYEAGQLRFEISMQGQVTEYTYNGFGERIAMRQYLGGRYEASQRPSLSEMKTWANGQDKQASELTEYTYQRGQLHTQSTYHRLDKQGQGTPFLTLKSSLGVMIIAKVSLPAVAQSAGCLLMVSMRAAGSRGITVTVVDAHNHKVSAQSFDTYGRQEASAELVAHLATLKASAVGQKVIVTTSDEWTHRLSSEAQAALGAMGIDQDTLESAEIRSAFMAVIEAQDGHFVTTHQAYRPRRPEAILTHHVSNAEHTRTTYDAFGNLLSTQTLTGKVKTGQLAVKTSTTQVFDGLNRVTSTTNAKGQTTTSQYMDASRQVLVTNEAGVTTRRTFSQRGELVSEVVGGPVALANPR